MNRSFGTAVLTSACGRRWQPTWCGARKAAPSGATGRPTHGVCAHEPVCSWVLCNSISVGLPLATADTFVLLQRALPLVDQLFRPGHAFKKPGCCWASCSPGSTCKPPVGAVFPSAVTAPQSFVAGRRPAEPALWNGHGAVGCRWWEPIGAYGVSTCLPTSRPTRPICPWCPPMNKCEKF